MVGVYLTYWGRSLRCAAHLLIILNLSGIYLLPLLAVLALRSG